MAPRRAQQAAIAAASDGSVLLNVVSLLPASVLARLGKALGDMQPIFVGVPLKQSDAESVVARLDDAAAEAAAVLIGRSAKRPKRRR